MQQSRIQQRSRKQKPPADRRLRLSKKLATYSAAVGSLCLAPQLCPADVIAYTPTGGTQTIDRFQDFSVDLDDNGSDDFLLVWGLYFGGSNFFGINGGETNAVDAPYNGSFSAVKMIPAGGMIPTDFDPSTTAAFSGFIGSRGYVAVHFSPVNAGSPRKNYGYLDVEVNGGNDQLTIYGGAYETVEGDSITTPTGVPEPGSLAALAFGGLVAASRRRRKPASCE